MIMRRAPHRDTVLTVFSTAAFVVAATVLLLVLVGLP
jgi:hypothetical protein